MPSALFQHSWDATPHSPGLPLPHPAHQRAHLSPRKCLPSARLEVVRKGGWGEGEPAGAAGSQSAVRRTGSTQPRVPHHRRRLARARRHGTCWQFPGVLIHAPADRTSLLVDHQHRANHDRSSILLGPASNLEQLALLGNDASRRVKHDRTPVADLGRGARWPDWVESPSIF